MGYFERLPRRCQKNSRRRIENRLDRVPIIDSSEPHVESLVVDAETVLLAAESSGDRRVDVVGVDGTVGPVLATVVCLAMDETAVDAGPCHSPRQAAWRLIEFEIDGFRLFRESEPPEDAADDRCQHLRAGLSPSEHSEEPRATLPLVWRTMLRA